MKFVLLVILIINYFKLFHTYSKIKVSKTSSETSSRSKFKSLFSLNLSSFKSNSKLNFLNYREKYQGYEPIKFNVKENIGPGPIYSQGWKNFFILTPKTKSDNSSKKFSINDSFKEEIFMRDQENKNNYGNTDPKMFIPNERSFYFVLTDQFVYVLSSRFPNIAKTIKILDLKTISDVTIVNESGLKGGIEDLGNFKEGFCFSLKGKNKDNDYFKWIICADDYENKCDLMKKMIALKLKLQIACSNTKEDKDAFNKISDSLQQTTSSKPIWVSLSDWSLCDSKCGAGNQTLTRYCLKSTDWPDCDGSPTITRPCNNSPCGPRKEEIIQSELLPPEIRIMPVSIRPQRFSRCIIKEEDMEIVRYDLCTVGNCQPLRIPSRVILNNETISVLKGESITSSLVSYKLKDLKLIQRLKEEPKKCLKIGIEENKFTIMCVMNQNIFNEKIEVEIDPVKRWIKDIMDFRDDCNIKSTKDNYLNDPRVTKLINLIKQKDCNQKIEKIKIINQDRQEKQEDQLLKIAQLKALRALQKEMKYDERLEKEELMREQREEEQVKEEYIIEEEKKKKLLTSILSMNSQKEQIEDQNKLKERLAVIERDLKSKLIEQRRNAMNKINLLRMAHERKSKKLREKIGEMKGEFTTELVQAQKEGDAMNCIKAIQEKNFVQYCKENFATSCTLKECESKDNFCVVCCENQFGEMKILQREDCLKKCMKV